MYIRETAVMNSLARSIYSQRVRRSRMQQPVRPLPPPPPQCRDARPLTHSRGGTGGYMLRLCLRGGSSSGGCLQFKGACRTGSASGVVPARTTQSQCPQCWSSQSGFDRVSPCPRPQNTLICSLLGHLPNMLIQKNKP